MRSRIRNLDSKVSFFAFADIMTAVSGTMIFITLTLSLELLQSPSVSGPEYQDPVLKQQQDETALRQAEIDDENDRLGQLLANAAAAPSDEKLKTDIAALKLQIAEEKKKRAALDKDISSATAVNLEQDEKLGINGRKVEIAATGQKTAEIAVQEGRTRESVADLQRLIAAAKSRLLNLKAREGQIWIIPDLGKGNQEPLLVTVAGKGIEIDRFDHPEQHKEFPASTARAEFTAFFSHANSREQYFVFMIRPSGIASFKELSELARHAGFEIGSDALEENEEIHFSSPPPDEPSQPPPRLPDEFAGVPTGFGRQPGGGGQGRTPSSRPGDRAGGSNGAGGNSGPPAGQAPGNGGKGNQPGSSSGGQAGGGQAGGSNGTGGSGNSGGPPSGQAQGNGGKGNQPGGSSGGQAGGGQAGGSNGTGGSGNSGGAPSGQAQGDGGKGSQPGGSSGGQAGGDQAGGSNGTGGSGNSGGSPSGQAQGDGGKGNQSGGSSGGQAGGGQAGGGQAGGSNGTGGSGSSGGSPSGQAQGGGSKGNQSGGSPGGQAGGSQAGGKTSPPGESQGRSSEAKTKPGEQSPEAGQTGREVQSPVPTPAGLNDIPKSAPPPKGFWQKVLEGIGIL